MKKILTVVAVLLTFTAFSQQTELDATAREAMLKKAHQDRIEARNAQQVHWDSINTKGSNEYVADVHKRFGQKVGDKIAAGKVEVGFTKAMCEASWGTPDKSLASNGKESWYYKKYKSFLTFKNGKLISITD